MISADRRYRYVMDYIFRNKYQTFARGREPWEVIVRAQPGVVATIRTPDGFVLCRHGRMHGDSLECVRGYMESDESAGQAAMREAAEEIGLSSASITGVVNLGMERADDSWIDQSIYHVLIIAEPPESFRLQSSERIRGVETLTLDDVRRRMVDGSITDGFTMAAFACYDAWSRVHMSSNSNS
jgi:8-oxo-dGTP pyrophosphatase MutT (NUDIX family)